MKVKRLFIKLAQDILHRPDLNFSEDVPLSYYLRIAFERIFMLIRGACRGLWFKHHGSRLMIGSHVHIFCSNKIEAGDGVSIQSGVTLNALSREGMHLGNNCSIGRNTSIKISGSMVEIGKGFWLGNYSTFANDCFVGSAGGVRIGDYVAIGQNVRFHSENHEFSDPDKKICEQGTNHKGIQIGNDCWIGAGAVFLDGAEIGNGCVVGANAVVKGRFPDKSVIAGVPAKIIRHR